MVLELMNDNDDQVRKVAALRCLEAFPKARLGKLLDVYVDQDEFRYYNVIHWLDLGVTMPRHFVRKDCEVGIEGCLIIVFAVMKCCVCTRQCSGEPVVLR